MHFISIIWPSSHEWYEHMHHYVSYFILLLTLINAYDVPHFFMIFRRNPIFWSLHSEIEVQEPCPFYVWRMGKKFYGFLKFSVFTSVWRKLIRWIRGILFQKVIYLLWQNIYCIPDILLQSMLYSSILPCCSLLNLFVN